jgi:hypothetical protein
MFSEREVFAAQVCFGLQMSNKRQFFHTDNKAQVFSVHAWFPQNGK